MVKRSERVGKKAVELNRGTWTAEEDEKLVSYVVLHGDKKWRALPAKAGLKRCGKSCRLRWLNYLRPDIKRGNISEDEEDLIIRLHNLLGNRWSIIAGRIPGRTDNEIKNHWNTHLCKRSLTIDDLNNKHYYHYPSAANVNNIDDILPPPPTPTKMMSSTTPTTTTTSRADQEELHTNKINGTELTDHPWSTSDLLGPPDLDDLEQFLSSNLWPGINDLGLLDDFGIPRNDSNQEYSLIRPDDDCNINNYQECLQDSHQVWSPANFEFDADIDQFFDCQAYNTNTLRSPIAGQ